MARAAQLNQMAAEAAAVAAALREAGVDAVFLKGHGTEAAYGPQYLRSLGDLDVALRSPEAYWRCVDLLAHRGYRPTALTVRRDAGSGTWSAVGGLERPGEEFVEGSSHLELQAGAQPLSWTSAHRFGESLWAGPELAVGGGTLRVPPAEDSLVVTVGEMLERPRVRVRDCLDIAMLTARLDPPAVARVAARLADLCLGDEVARVERELSLHPSTSDLAGPVRDLRRRCEAGPTRFAARAPGLLRVAGRHAGRLAARDGSTRQAVRAVGMFLALELAKRLAGYAASRPLLAYAGSRVDVGRWLAAGVHTQTLPVAPVPVGGLRLVACDGGPLLVTPGGCYLALVIPAVGEQRFAAALECAAGLA